MGRNRDKPNKMISIGYLGVMKCYLNIPTEEAIKRYTESEGVEPGEFDEGMVNVFYFDDEFGAYSVYDDEWY
jgi:hypothetical protein